MARKSNFDMVKLMAILMGVGLIFSLGFVFYTFFNKSQQEQQPIILDDKLTLAQATDAGVFISQVWDNRNDGVHYYIITEKEARSK